MPKYPQLILPSPSKNGPEPASATTGRSLSKRRRMGAGVACNNCRAKRVAVRALASIPT
jgi:hypothetical protein